MLITIDGPAGVGKSTLAKRFAQALGIAFFETGALYRMITLKALDEKLDLKTEPAFEKLLNSIRIETNVIEGKRCFLANGVDVTTKLRSESVTENVALVSTYLSVRKKVESIQRMMSQRTDAVFEGRDMGSVVFPTADLKFFLTASPETRAKRRFDEMQNPPPFETVLEEVKKRDEMDSTREHSPLVCPEGAIVIDTSNLTIEQVENKMLQSYFSLFKKRTKPSMFYRTLRWISYILSKICYRHEAIGLENIPNTGGIIASNHASFLDPILIGNVLRRSIHYFARDSLFKNPLFGFLLKKLSVHPIKRESQSASVMKQAKSLILSGQTTIIFPEGARSLDGKVGPFKEGAAFIAATANGVIIPTYIDGTFQLWPKGKKFPKLFGKTKVIFGKPIQFSSYLHLPKKEALIACTNGLEKAVHQLKDSLQK